MTKSILSTRVIINWLKLIIIFPCILFSSIVITAFELYGMEFILLAIFIFTVLWFYRITYSGNNVVEGLSVEVKLKLNFFGVKFITIKVNGIKLIKNKLVKGDEFEFFNDKHHLSVKLKLLKGDVFSPDCTLAVL
ncbi:hypothetical protein [Shewanella sp.]|uniref:hypothetical protein n=1 Tax=Shewanella sp. TaxID=50422 RepID=UPI001EBECDB4|nr:hypothetical protein [Shewanella sp.]NRB25629.1 hypothetical protein [Shewanella sp.]